MPRSVTKCSLKLQLLSRNVAFVCIIGLFDCLFRFIKFPDGFCIFQAGQTVQSVCAILPNTICTADRQRWQFCAPRKAIKVLINSPSWSYQVSLSRWIPKGNSSAIRLAVSVTGAHRWALLLYFHVLWCATFISMLMLRGAGKQSKLTKTVLSSQ